AAFTSSRYELGEDFASLEAGGTSHAARLYARYPLRRGSQRNIWLGANVERRYLEDRIDSIDTETDKTTDLAEINISGDLTDRFAGGGVNRWRVSGTFG